MKRLEKHHAIRGIVPAWIWITLLSIVVLFLLLIDAYSLSLFRGTIDVDRFGTLGEWFQGIVTVGALAIGIWAIRTDRRIAEQATAEARAAQEKVEQSEASRLVDQKRQRASQVFVWLQAQSHPVTELPEAVAVQFANLTGVPVFEWIVRSADGTELLSSTVSGVILPERDTFIRLSEPVDTSSEQLSVEFQSFMGERLRRSGAEFKVLS